MSIIKNCVVVNWELANAKYKTWRIWRTPAIIASRFNADTLFLKYQTSNPMAGRHARSQTTTKKIQNSAPNSNSIINLIGQSWIRALWRGAFHSDKKAAEDSRSP
jgi:hypothetical protein